MEVVAGPDYGPLRGGPLALILLSQETLLGWVPPSCRFGYRPHRRRFSNACECMLSGYSRGCSHCCKLLVRFVVGKGQYCIVGAGAKLGVVCQQMLTKVYKPSPAILGNFLCLWTVSCLEPACGLLWSQDGPSMVCIVFALHQSWLCVDPSWPCLGG